MGGRAEESHLIPSTVEPAFVAIARQGENAFWRYAAGAIAVALVYLGFSVAAATALLVISGGGTDVGSLFDGTRLSPAGLLILLMVPSLGLLLGTVGVNRVLHRRPLRSLLTAAPAMRWRRVGTGAALWLGLTMAVEALAYTLSPDNYAWSFEASSFAPVAVVALLLVPIQSAAEEIFFRGYLLQGVGVLLGRPWVAVLLTSVGFGLVHGSNPEMAQFGRLFLLYYVGMGVLLALVTLLDGGLELAIGVHAVNNLYGALLVSFPGSLLDMPTVVRMASFPVRQMSILGACAGLAFYLLARRSVVPLEPPSGQTRAAS